MSWEQLTSFQGFWKTLEFTLDASTASATVLMDAENNLALARCSASYSQAYRLFL